MNLKVIKTETEYNQALERLEEIFGAKLGTAEGDELEVLSILIDKYESEHHAIPMFWYRNIDCFLWMNSFVVREAKLKKLSTIDYGLSTKEKLPTKPKLHYSYIQCYQKVKI